MDFAAHNKSTEIVLGDLQSGDSFGELALLNDKPRAASVKAMQATFCIILTKEMFKSAIMDLHENQFNPIM